MNALMLTMHCEKEGYKIPVFATRDRIFSMNFQNDANGQRVPAVDKDGNKLPFLHIRRITMSIITVVCISYSMLTRRT